MFRINGRWPALSLLGFRGLRTLTSPTRVAGRAGARRVSYQSSGPRRRSPLADTSFTSQAAGAAYVIFAPPDRVLAVGRYRLLRATSAYSAEVVAFREALRHLIAARYFESVALYTDCLSLLQALASPRNAEPHVLEIRALVRKLSRTAHVYLYHVPGHAGVFGNEVADFIAERAAHRGIEASLPLPFRAAGASYAGSFSCSGRLDGEQNTHAPNSSGG
ncbi:hypothetical protein HPB52_023765 [Rhipicephalus sanguineus]|uniref:RNase H type-1 domain-containing protein n=1 Tax=Rhipicephalus sanguineus TaxID=34632 RepID=A0A9D4Q4H1_RHISA|nr:hypothetical protein HPB52_023765 [Rhipicephalus sanguineus]